MADQEWRNEVERTLDDVARDIATEHSFTHAYHSGDKRRFLASLRIIQTTEISRRPLNNGSHEIYQNNADAVYRDPHSGEGSQQYNRTSRRCEEMRAQVNATGQLGFLQQPTVRVHFDPNIRCSSETRTSQNLRWRREREEVGPHRQTIRTRSRYIVTLQHVICVKADRRVRIYPTSQRNAGVAIGGGGGAAGGGLAGAAGGAAAGAGAGALAGAPFGGVGAIPGAFIGGAIGGTAGLLGGFLVGGSAGGAGGAVIGGIVGRHLARNRSIEITAREVFQARPNYCYDEAENLVYCTVLDEITEERREVDINPL